MSPAERREAFEQLFQNTRTDLLVYLLRRSTNPEDAADVLAQVYVIAWQKIDEVPAGDHARPWLFGVARNLLSKAWSRQRSDEALVHRLASELREAIRPVDSAEAAATAVRQALMSLPEIDREIVTLTAWERLTPHQIAVVVGRPPNVVRVRLHRARARLRRGLGSLVAVESGLAVESIGHER
jgi:RNA polymerase sigma factor (sigma-70 family)